MLKDGTGRLLLYLVLTHMAAAVAGVLGGSWAVSRGLGPGWLAGGAAVLGALLGIPLTSALRAGIEAAASAVKQLARGLPVATLPRQGHNLLSDLFAGIESLAERERGWSSGQAAALRQAEETAAQNERNRLARDLHDSIKQQLFSINASAATALARWTADPEGAKAALADVRQSAREANAEMQALLQQLRPMPLDRAGLVDALREQCEALAYRTGATVTTEFAQLPDEERLPPGAQEALFRIAQEALSNIARHARAGSVQLRLQTTGQEVEPALILTIADDGQGFDPAAARAGMGIDNMKERAQRTGAVSSVQSAPGEGTTVSVRLPLVTQTALERKETMNATIHSTIKHGVRAHTGLALGLGLALFLALGMLPVVARTLNGGPQFPGIQIIVPGAIAIAGVVFAVLSYGRLQRAQRALTLTAGERSKGLLRLEREIQGQQMWFLLVAAIVLPSALLRQNYQPLPTAAIAAGGMLAVLSLVQVFRQRSATEAYWNSLDAAERETEIAEAWSQRFVLLLVLAITLPGYIFLLGFGGSPLSDWFSLPPGRDQAINIVVTFYLLVVATWVVVNYRQVLKWHGTTER